MLFTLASTNCGNSTVQTDDLIMVIDYNDTTVRGSTITLSCPPGHVLIGSNSSTCMGNGEWEPDPREVECKGESRIDVPMY